MRPQDQKKKLTVNERCLLHILGHQRHSESWEVPFALTQNGLALGVGINRSEVPRSVRTLKDQRLIYDERKHVIGDSRKHVVYFLTRSGLEEATRLRGHLARSGYEPQLWPVDDTPRQEARAASGPGSLEYFFGRDAELGALKDAYAKKRRPLVFIYGIAGVGKTTLVQRFVGSLGAIPPRLIWHKCQPFDSLDYLVRSISRQISLSNTEGDAHMKARELIDRMFGLDCIVVMDDIHRLPSSCLGLIEMMKDRMGSAESSPMFIFTSRDQLRLYDVRDVKIKHTVVEVDLDSLDRKSAGEFIRVMLGKRKDGGGSKIEQFYKMTGGLPLAIEVLQYEVDPLKGGFRDFLKEEVISSLTPGQQRMAAYLSTYRSDADVRALSYCDPGMMGVRDFEALISKRLVKRSPDGGDARERYFIHEALRELFASRATPAEAAKFHAWCAAYYEEIVWDLGQGALDAGQVQALKELCHHQLSSGQSHTLLGLLPGYIERLEQGGFFEDGLMLLTDILEHTPKGTVMTTSDMLMLAQLKDRILAHWGAWDVFAEHGFFNHFLELLLLKRTGKPAAIEPVYEIKGRGVDKGQTLKEITGAIRELEAVGDTEGVVDLYLEMGWQSLFAQGDSDILGYLENGARLAKKVRPEASLRFGIMRADVLFAQGEPEAARAQCKVSLRSARKPADIIFLKNLLGHIEFSLGASGQAAECYSSALETSNANGNVMGSVYSELHLRAVEVLGWDPARARPDDGSIRHLIKLAGTYRWFGDLYGHAFSSLVQAGAAMMLGETTEAARAMDECIYLYSRADIRSPTFDAGLKTLKYQIEGLESV